jgi:DNA-binding LacI/PurR family transcriptional regulator
VATDARLAAYFGALARHKLPEDERWIAYGAFSAESGYLATRELLARQGPRPTAILAGNDTIALGVIAAIVEAGLSVPHDIAVVGFDDLPIAPFMQPPLTTIHNPAALQGEVAAEMLVRLLRHEQVETPRIRVPVNLVVRQSCGQALPPEDRRLG